MPYALLIDDDSGLVESFVDAARDEGLEIATASTWDDGLQTFLATAPILVMADYNLPGSQHGLKLLFAIARLRPSVRLVLFSAYLNDDDIKRVKDLGLVDDAFRKLDPIETSRRLLAELQQAAALSEVPTDWARFGLLAGRNAAIDHDAFDELDAFLREHRLPGGRGLQ